MNKPAWQFEHSVECNANKDFVWSFWTDVSNWERIEGKAVEWIRLDGPFATGSNGATKMPGQEPHHWKIAQLIPGSLGVIEMTLEGATFHNRMRVEALGAERTLITQTMSLTGPKAGDFAPGMQMFETTAPQGLAKMARAMEMAFNDREPDTI